MAWVATFLLLCVVLPTQAQVEGPERITVSPRNASYQIEVTLDDEAKMLTGRQVLTWRNLQQQPTDELWFHLYWNAWRNNRSTWMIEDRIRGRSSRGSKVKPGDWSYIEIEAARLFPSGDDDTNNRPIELPLRFAAPDDGNPDDRTVVVLDLPQAVQEQETIQVEMEWKAKIPRTFARTGFRGKFFFLAHWFPKLGVYEPDGWNCPQYHAATEYYSDYGVYDVRITVPSYHVVGATGRELGRTENDDETTTYRYYQEDVHAFSWTASPQYIVKEEVFEEPGLPPVEMRLLLQPEHSGQAERHFQATRAALKYYGTWYGAYPYGHVTMVDPAYGSGAGGMEYPTFFTCGTRLFNPFGGDSPESVTVHEAGHQFWYGLVGSNEFEHAWIDEGFNTFSTIRTLEEAYPDRILIERYIKPPGRTTARSGFFPLRLKDIVVPRWQDRINRYRRSAPSDVPLLATYEYHPRTAGNISYSKTALWLRTLENHLGWPTLQGILSTFFERYRYRHPSPEDFLAVANEVAGTDLSWFFDQVLGDAVVFDYAIESVKSYKLETKGWVGEGAELSLYEAPDEDAETEALFRTDVMVTREQGGQFPVDVLLVFEDGHEERREWDGVAHWHRIIIDRPSKLRYAVVDPERVLMLDVGYKNNAKFRKAQSRLPAVKWSSKWTVWLQDWMSNMAFFF